MQPVIQFFSAAFFIIYMLVAFVWPSVRTYRQTGINPVTFGNADNAHDFAGRLFKVTVIMIPVTIAFYWLGKDVYAFLLPVHYIETTAVQVAGMIICLASLLWTIIAQAQMQNSWRIGIDEEHKTELVTKGLFRYSRNPIFLGMLFTLAGFFLLLPNAITFAIAVAGYILIQVQIRLEEEFLAAQHGNAYLVYKSTVKRLL